jgi:hypothetical protein
LRDWFEQFNFVLLCFGLTKLLVGLLAGYFVPVEFYLGRGIPLVDS